MDNINPEHYKTNANECFDEMIHLFGIEAVKSFCKCNVHKYRYRAEHKNGNEDLKKADWYMNKLIELDALSKHKNSELANPEGCLRLLSNDDLRGDI